MDILALLAVALLQFASMTIRELQETVDVIKTALVEQCVEPPYNEKGPAM